MLSRTISQLRKSLVLAWLVVGISPALAGTPARPVVVELYTSQGCSSCPPADAFLARLARRPDVLALSLPVTYWDMLGWKDTLASKANTDRQKAYAAAMGRGGIYTPQMIVDGVSNVVGSRVAAVDKTIAAREADMRAVPVHLKVTAKEVAVAVGAARVKAYNNATIWLFRIDPKAKVAITRGENDGRTIVYRNVVRSVKAVGVWKGKPVSFDLPLKTLGGDPGDEIAVIVQEHGYGRIVGATPVEKVATAPLHP